MAVQAREATDELNIALLGSLVLSVAGRRVPEMPNASRRLVVFLALSDRAVSRSTVAGTLWPDASAARAGVSLRAALSRLDPDIQLSIESTGSGLALADSVVIDLVTARALAFRLLDRWIQHDSADLSVGALETLSRELLPDWYDEWVIIEAEDWRQLRMTALEALARLLIIENRLPEAAAAARAAMRAEPYRETAHVTLIEVHLAEGNQSEALRVHARYSELLMAGLNLEPTEHMTRLIEPLLEQSRARLAS